MYVQYYIYIVIGNCEFREELRIVVSEINTHFLE